MTDVCFQLEFGVVYSCLEDKMYKARRGKGAFCNDEKIQVSDVKGNTAELLRSAVPVGSLDMPRWHV